MKNKFLIPFLVLFLALNFNSCSVDEGELRVDSYVLTSSKRTSFQSDLLKHLKMAMPEEFTPDVFISDSKIESIDGIYYLKTFYNNEYVSTSLLEFNKDTNLKDDFELAPQGASCTSKACASCCGCLPKLGGYCSECTSGAKDCSRTTTAVVLEPIGAD